MRKSISGTLAVSTPSSPVQSLGKSLSMTDFAPSTPSTPTRTISGELRKPKAASLEDEILGSPADRDPLSPLSLAVSPKAMHSPSSSGCGWRTAGAMPRELTPSGNASGRLVVSADGFVQWFVPKARLQVKTFSEEMCMERAPPIVSPTLLLMEEPCVLKLWSRGRAGFVGSGRSEQNRHSCAGQRWAGRECWMTLGIFPKNHGAHLKVRLLIGGREEPWADSGPREVYTDSFMARSEQFLNALGQRPFAWDDLSDGMLPLGVEPLDDCRNPKSHKAASRGGRKNKLSQ